jgi:uncharacterized protein YbjT (DUF2867 family)
LLNRLQEKKALVVCLTRRPEALAHKKTETTEFIQGDVLSKDDLVRAFAGVDTAYYLIHSMGDKGNFEETDRLAAKNFAMAAKACGVHRIIYVGGLGNSKGDLSSHLRSRQEVGQILKASGAQVIEFRASIVIGSGSLSFELVRSLVDRLPILIMPKWVQVPAQPIWINDLLSYLEKAIDMEISGNQIYEIGGTDIVSYREIMEEYARQRGLRRLMFNVPVLTPYLSSLWLGLVTPVFARTGRKLVESLKNPSVVLENRGDKVFDVRPIGLNLAIEKSIKNEDRDYAETRWSDALSSSGNSNRYGGVRFGRRILDSRSIVVNCARSDAFSVIESIGGEQGWFYADWIWELRGFIDLLFGGVGMRRRRKHPSKLNVGEALDWWRVEKLVPNELLLLQAEMKVPGRAWLKFELSPIPDKKSIRITQTAIYDPKGLAGLLYWYLLYPIHALIFSGMLREIGRRAQAKS